MAHQLALRILLILCWRFSSYLIAAREQPAATARKKTNKLALPTESLFLRNSAHSSQDDENAGINERLYNIQDGNPTIPVVAAAIATTRAERTATALEHSCELYEFYLNKYGGRTPPDASRVSERHSRRSRSSSSSSSYGRGKGESGKGSKSSKTSKTSSSDNHSSSRWLSKRSRALDGSNYSRRKAKSESRILSRRRTTTDYPDCVDCQSTADLQIYTFTRLLEFSGLEDLFLCDGPFTTLIPTDAAFVSLPDCLLDFIFEPLNMEGVREIIFYHVIPNLYVTPNLQAGPAVTVQNSAIQIGTSPRITFNNATLLEKDIESYNGVYHLIDAVLLPPHSQATIPDLHSCPQATAAPVAPVPVPTQRTTSAPTALALQPTPRGIRTSAPLSFPRPTTAPGNEPPPTLAPAPAPTRTPASSPTSPPTRAPQPQPTASPSSVPLVVASSMPSSTPSVGDFTVRVGNYTLAYDAPGLTEDLSVEGLSSLVATTQDFYNRLFVVAFRDDDELSYRRTELIIQRAEFGLGLPRDNFGYLIDFDMDIVYGPGSAEPDERRIYGTLSATTDDYANYIINYVRAIPELSSTIEVAFQRKEFLDIDEGRARLRHTVVANSATRISTGNTEITSPRQKNEKIAISIVSIATLAVCLLGVAGGYMLWNSKRKTVPRHSNIST